MYIWAVYFILKRTAERTMAGNPIGDWPIILGIVLALTIMGVRKLILVYKFRKEERIAQEKRRIRYARYKKGRNNEG